MGKRCTQHVYSTAQVHTDFFYLETAEFILSLCHSLELPSKNWITNKNNNPGMVVVFSASEIAYGIWWSISISLFFVKSITNDLKFIKKITNRASWLTQMLKPFSMPFKFHNAFERYFHDTRG